MFCFGYGLISVTHGSVLIGCDSDQEYVWMRTAGAVGLGELLILSLLRLASYYIDFVYVSDSDDHEICSIQYMWYIQLRLERFAVLHYLTLRDATIETRSDTRLPQSRAGGQEQCRRRSLGHLGRSRMLKNLKNAEKVKRGPTNRPTNQPTDGPTQRGVESSSLRLKRRQMRRKSRK